MLTLELDHDWDCECDQCRADDAEAYAEYLYADRKNLEMWARYRRNHPNGLPVAEFSF
jgi:hypothetical protein